MQLLRSVRRGRAVRPQRPEVSDLLAQDHPPFDQRFVAAPVQSALALGLVKIGRAGQLIVELSNQVPSCPKKGRLMETLAGCGQIELKDGSTFEVTYNIEMWLRDGRAGADGRIKGDFFDLQRAWQESVSTLVLDDGRRAPVVLRDVNMVTGARAALNAHPE